MKGTFEELDDVTSPYGPIQSWKEHVQERQKQRASVKVQYFVNNFILVPDV